jgi:hypothetical protein
MKTFLGIVALILIIWGVWAFTHRGSNGPAASSTPTAVTDNGKGTDTSPVGTPATADQIRVTAPTENQTISTPLKVSGQARGNWFFEASAPVYIVEAGGNVLGQGVIQATGDWMTTDFVPFSGSIAFSAPTPGVTTGAIVFMNDNPSGQASTSYFWIVPIHFAPTSASSTAQ